MTPARLSSRIAAAAAMTAAVCALSATAAPVLVVATNASEASATVEALQAQALGHAVDVVGVDDLPGVGVDQVRRYAAVIVARSGCAIAPQHAGAVADALSRWSVALSGPVLVTLTDPAAYGWLGGGDEAGAALARAGISWAVQGPGTTGLYANLSCLFTRAPAGVVADVLVPFGRFTVEGACTGQHGIVDAGVLAGVNGAQLSGLLCAEQAVFRAWPRDFAVAAAPLDPLVGLAGAASVLARGVADRVPPEVVLDALPTARPDRPLHAQGHVSDLGELEQVTWSLNGVVVDRPTPGPSGEVSVDVTLAEGLNQLALEAIDAAGNSRRAEAVIRVDANAPSVRLDPVAPVLSAPALRLSGFLSAPGGLGSVRLLVDGALAAYPRVAQDGRFELAVPLAEGAHRVTLEARSKALTLPLAGTTPAVTATLELPVRVDTVPPRVTLDAAPELTAQQALALSGQALDSGSGVDRLELRVNGEPMPAPRPGPDGRFDADVWLVEGDNLVEVTAFDHAGNAAAAQHRIALDSLAPSLAVLRPHDGEVLGGEVAEVEVELADRSESRVSIDGKVTALPRGGGRVVGTVRLGAEGPRTFTVVAQDAAGHRAVRELTVIRDAAAPVITVELPDDTLTGPLPDDRLRVTVRVADASETFLTTPVGEVRLPAGGGSTVVDVPMVEGVQRLVFRATDSGGRTAQSVRTVRYDVTPPEAAFDLAEGTWLRGDAEVGLRAADALAGIAAVEVHLDGAPLGVRAEGDGYVVLVRTAGVENGRHALTAQIRDHAGNLRALSAALLVDHAPPQPRLVSPAAGVFVGGTITVSATGADAHAGVRSLSLLAGERLLASCAADTCAASFDTRTLPDGALTFTARAVDHAGNSAVHAESVRVDNTAPERFLVAPADGAVVRGVFELRAEVKDSGFADLECAVEGRSLGASSSATTAWQVASPDFLDGPLALRCTARDLAGNATTEGITVRADNWSERLEPARLTLDSGRGQGSGGKVELHLEGAGLALLVPHLRAVSLWVEGAPAVPADPERTDGSAADRDGDGLPELTVRFDRRELARALEGPVADGRIPTGTPVTARLLAGDRVVATHALVVSGRRAAR